jgi:hypothetical protein
MGAEPISPNLDEDLFRIHVAKELGVPVTHWNEIPTHLIWSYRIKLEWDALEANKRHRSSSRKPKPAAAPRRKEQP